MPVDEPSSPPRRSAQTIALLAAVIAVPGLIGLSISFLQRPPQPPVSAPLPSPSPTPVAHGPVSGFGYSLVDDAAAQQVVFFGGIDSYEQTWLWDGGRWKLAAPRSHPPGRFGAAAAYDPVTTDVLLFGGRLAPGQLANDTWAWDGRTWRELDGGAEGPPPGEGALMAWDAATAQMVLVTPGGNVGGETWLWTGAHWSRDLAGDLTSSPLVSGMTFDPVTRSLLLVSPLQPPTGPGPSTWSWSGSQWRELDAVPPIATTGLVVDPLTGQLVTLSNPTPSQPSLLWHWTGIDWTAVPTSMLAIDAGTEVDDERSGRLLIVGFSTEPTQPAPQPVHVWVWNGHAWRCLAAC